MSPEPTEEPIDNLNTSSIQADGVFNMIPESDSEDEDAGMSGYMPLSQIPLEGEPLNDEEDDEEDFEWTSTHTESQQMPGTNNQVDSNVDPETLEVWASTSNSSNIDLDLNKINLIKSVMVTFKLPSTAIPEWANAISEEQWEEQVIQRIKEIQKDKN